MQLTGKLFLTAAIAGFCLTEADAISISTLYNTGVDGAGNVLPDNTVGDPHYSLVSVPSGLTSILVRSAANVSGTYIADNAFSRWIGPNNSPTLSSDVGDYTYRTTFDLTGLNPFTASISGGWSTDNSGLRILINGVDTGALPTSFTQFSTGFAAFSIANGFISGINTLDFVVNNGGGPTALRVQMTGTADSLTSAVPEGGDTVFLFSGVILLMGALRRRLA